MCPKKWHVAKYYMERDKRDSPIFSLPGNFITLLGAALKFTLCGEFPGAVIWTNSGDPGTFRKR